jgi:uncharacterized membrane protein
MVHMSHFLKSTLSWLLIVVIAVLLATCMRVLLLASFKVPTYSMLLAIAGGYGGPKPQIYVAVMPLHKNNL